MSIDFLDLLSVSRRLVRSRLADLTRGMPSNERAEFIEQEAESLADSLAEVVDGRIEELRQNLLADARIQIREVA